MAGLIKSVGNIFTGGSGTSGSQAATIASPFQSQYGRYQDPLYNLVTNPSSITSTPGYQFRFDQGMQALERTLAGSGELSSGKAMTEAEQYGQNFATGELQRQENLLSGLSGAGFGSPGAAGQLFMGGQSPINQVLSNFLGQGLSLGSNLFSSSGLFSSSAMSASAIDAAATDTSAAAGATDAITSALAML